MKSIDERNEEYEARELAFSDWCTTDRVRGKVALLMANGQITTAAILEMLTLMVADAEPEKGSFSSCASDDKFLRSVCKGQASMVMSALRTDFGREHAE